MPANKEEIALRASEALKLKLEGTTYTAIGKLQNTSESTARRDVAYAMIVAKDDDISLDVEELMAQQFAHSLHAGEIEGLFLDDVQRRDKLEARDIAEVNKIKTSGQKMYSFLKGANSDKTGGEKEIVIINYADTVQVPTEELPTTDT